MKINISLCSENFMIFCGSGIENMAVIRVNIVT
jgi:hypothetical protein